MQSVKKYIAGTVGPSELVETDLADETAVHDPQFYKAADKYGDEYVDMYLDEVSQLMGETIVQAFEQHDQKQYAAARDSFKTVYNLLFPVSEEASLEAANGYISALIHHDAIEDGAKDIDTVFEDGYEDEPLVTAEDIGDAPGWDDVRACFDVVERQLQFPSSVPGQNKPRDPYHVHQTEFFRHHTIARESQDRERNNDYIKFAERQMREHARKSQLIKFSSLIDYHNISDDAKEEIASISPIDYNTPFREHIVHTYLNAVDVHDRHTEIDQQANVDRMTRLYRAVLQQVIHQQ